MVVVGNSNTDPLHRTEPGVVVGKPGTGRTRAGEIRVGENYGTGRIRGGERCGGLGVGEGGCETGRIRVGKTGPEVGMRLVGVGIGCFRGPRGGCDWGGRTGNPFVWSEKEEF